MLPVRQYIVFDAQKLLDRSVSDLFTRDELEGALRAALGSGLSFAVESLPWARFVPSQPLDLPFVPQQVAVLVSPTAAEAYAVRDSVEALIVNEGGIRISGIGTDAPIGMADYSFPGSADPDIFGTRNDAHRLVGIDRLPAGLQGAGVNVVIIDSGLDSSFIPAGQWGGGWQLLPGGPAPGATTGERALHGMMVLHNILAVAPRARIYDVPLISPPRINDLPAFLADAEATFLVMLIVIGLLEQITGIRQQWVFVNAWAIYDRRSELPFRDYTENRPTVPNPARHLFIQLIDQLAANRFDIIFCAGNCGGICPDGRCGPNDIGPGRGIWGANAHPSALTVGAVRTDSSWIGYSSEGPGPGRAPLNKLARYKPDLCAPSHYEEDGGDYSPSRGTSAAAALAAGVVAAFRSKASWSQAAVPPAQLIQTLNNNTTERLVGLAWNRRLGNGILNVPGAVAAMPP